MVSAYMELSAAEVDARLASTSSLQLTAARVLLETGAAPLDDLLHDAIARGQPGDRAARSAARVLLEAGPAAAVDNVEELYEAGLPAGLPGGLAEVAIDHRETLLEKVRLARRRHQSIARQRASCYFLSPYATNLVCRHGSCTHHEPVARACSASHVPSLTACHLTEPCGLARRSTSRAEPAPPAPMASDGPISPIGRAMACHSSAAAALTLCRGRRRIHAEHTCT